jgi:hypothetical protein
LIFFLKTKAAADNAAVSNASFGAVSATPVLGFEAVLYALSDDAGVLCDDAADKANVKGVLYPVADTEML